MMVLIAVVADSEPLLEQRRRVAVDAADAVAAGLRIARAAAGARRAVVAVREDWRDAAHALRRAVPRELAEVRTVRAVVGCDDPRGLAADLLGPAERPAVVPVEVLPVGAARERRVEVVGAVARPGLHAAAGEVTIGELVAAAGGSPEPAWVAFDGGAASGRLVYADDAVRAETRALVVLPHRHGAVRRALLPAEDARLRAASTCSGCAMCTEVCPRALVGLPIAPHRALGAADCSGCGLCGAVCPVGLSPAHLLDARPAPARPGPHPERPLRGISVGRLAEMLDLARYAGARA